MGVDQTFLHGCLECPQVSKLYRGMAQIFGFHETLPLNPKDIFIWKKIYKGVNKNDRNHGKEAFFKIINMSTAHHINTQIKLGSYATIKSTANFIQNQVKIFLHSILKVASHTFCQSRKSWTVLSCRVLVLRCGVECCYMKQLTYLRSMYKNILRSYKKKK